MPGMIGRPMFPPRPRGPLVSMEQQQQQQQQEIMLQMSGQPKLPVNGPSPRLLQIPIVNLGNRPPPGGQIITQQGSQIELPFVRDQLPVMQLNSPVNEIGQNLNGAPNSQNFAGQNTGRVINGMIVSDQSGTGLGTAINTVPVQALDQQQGQQNGRILNGLFINRQVGTGLGQMPNGLPAQKRFIVNGMMVNNRIGTGIGQNGIGGGVRLVNPFGPESPFIRNGGQFMDVSLSQDGERSQEDVVFMQNQNGELPIIDGEPSVPQNNIAKELMIQSDSQTVDQANVEPQFGRRMRPLGFRPVGGRQMSINGNDAQNIVPLGFRPVDGRQMSMNGNDAQNIPLGFRPVDRRPMSMNNGNDAQNIVPLGFRQVDGRQMSMNGNDAQNIVPLGFRPVDGRQMAMNGNNVHNIVPLGFKPMQIGGVASLNDEPKQRIGQRGDQPFAPRRPQVIGFKPTTEGGMMSLNSDLSPRNKFNPNNESPMNDLPGAMIDSPSDSRPRSSVVPRSRSLPLGGFENPIFRRIPYMKSLMESGPYGHYSWLNMYM